MIATGLKKGLRIGTAMAALMASGAAWALPVTIDTNGYEGNWWDPTGVRHLPGDTLATVDLDPGTHYVKVNWEAAFYFDLDASGEVTILNGLDGITADGGAGQITFLPIPVTIDPSGFPGTINYTGGVIQGSDGVQDVLLVPGISHYNVVIGFHTEADQFRMMLAADGTVTTDNAGAAAGGDRLFTLNTTDVTIDPDDYTGLIFMRNISDLIYGGDPQTLTLVNNLDYVVKVHSNANLSFAVDASGQVSTQDTTSASASGSTLAFQTRAVDIDVGNYGGLYGTGHSRNVNVDAFFRSGSETRVFVVDKNTSLMTMGPYSTFSVDAGGQVTGSDPDTYAYGQDKVAFITHPVTIDVGDFAAQWWPTTALTSWGHSHTGSATLDLMADSDPVVVVGFSRYFTFNIDASGDVTLPAAHANLGTTADSTLTLDNILVSVEPAQDDVSWGFQLHGTGTTTGPSQVVLLPGDTGLYSDGQVTNISVEYDPCSVSPDTVEHPDNTFTLSCVETVVDTDGDGIADEPDNCASIFNPGQEDTDIDGVGDACDLCEGDDLTGDSDDDAYCDSDDNCVSESNTDQTDSDNDGIGDVCEGDTDLDGIIDDDDNCWETVNTDQADSDGDGLGDVCDDDDDDDGISDTDDNCQLLPNLGQDDTDGDGQGDECDGDDDADGVLDDDDLCPGTPMDVGYDDDGCSGVQFVELSCGEDADHPNHGSYVSCVARAGNQAAALGLISKKERASLVRTAAKK
ncbi:MAG: hypothetical protein ACI8RZ_002130 [Myxococcota bacterium]|jgi:hypothetical protein